MATIGQGDVIAQLPQGINLYGRPAWLAWLFVHLVQLVGHPSRLSTLLNWAYDYLGTNRATRLLLSPQPPRQRTAAMCDESA